MVQPLFADQIEMFGCDSKKGQIGRDFTGTEHKPKGRKRTASKSDQGTGMSKMPTYEEFYGYFEQCMKQKKDDPKIYTEWIEDKYEAWKLNEWKKEKGAKLIPIKNWRSTLRQCLPYRMRNKVKDLTVRAEILKPTGKMAQIENELILSAYNHFSVMKKLELKHEECFKFLYERGIFKDVETRRIAIHTLSFVYGYCSLLLNLRLKDIDISSDDSHILIDQMTEDLLSGILNRKSASFETTNES